MSRTSAGSKRNTRGTQFNQCHGCYLLGSFFSGFSPLTEMTNRPLLNKISYLSLQRIEIVILSRICSRERQTLFLAKS